MTSIDAIINRQLLKWELEKRGESDSAIPRPVPEPIITVSRQTGSRGSYFASRLAQKLDYQRMHREVIDAVCNSSGYIKRVVESLDSRFRSNLELMVESLFTGRSVDHSDYFRHLYKAILSMSRLGGVVLVGRGGNFILGPKHGFHIRFICPLEKRVENLLKYCGVSEQEARDAIIHSDNERKEFVARLFKANIDDPHQYDLVINSMYVDIEELVETTVTAIKGKQDKLSFLDHD
jgi:cytidylate kinase